MRNRTKRGLICPSCGSTVRIPLFWTLGIEIVFRCKECRLPFKTGYKMGAILSAVGLCLSLLTAQLFLYIFSIKLIPIALIMIIPLWILYSCGLRKPYMIYKSRKTARRLVQQSTDLNQNQFSDPNLKDDILNSPLESDPSI